MIETAEKKSDISRYVSLLVPDYIAESVQDIDFATLHAKGITCVALDIDNTLVPNGGVSVDKQTIDFFRSMRDAGYIQTLAIATNRSQKRMGDIAVRMHADVAFYASGFRRKPRAAYFEALLEAMDCSPTHAVMVGDKIIQDIAGGKYSGLTTVLVNPLGPAMWLERLLLKVIQ